MFAYVLAVSEINVYLFVRYFVYGNGEIDEAPTLLKFRRLLAWQLICNQWLLAREMEVNVPLVDEHVMETAPKHARIFRNRRWVCSAKRPYQQYMCSTGCGRKIRICRCSPGIWMCGRCHVNHCIQIQAEDCVVS